MRLARALCRTVYAGVGGTCVHGQGSSAEAPQTTLVICLICLFFPLVLDRIMVYIENIE